MLRLKRPHLISSVAGFTCTRRLWKPIWINIFPCDPKLTTTYQWLIPAFPAAAGLKWKYDAILPGIPTAAQFSCAAPWHGTE
jgi:hypothetical protein